MPTLPVVTLLHLPSPSLAGRQVRDRRQPSHLWQVLAVVGLFSIFGPGSTLASRLPIEPDSSGAPPGQPASEFPSLGHAQRFAPPAAGTGQPPAPRREDLD